MRIGLYPPDVPSRFDGFDDLNGALGGLVDIVSLYQAWDSPHDVVTPDALALLRARRATPMVTWEPWRVPAPGGAPESQPRFRLGRLLAGDHDAYIRGFASRVAQRDEPFFLRPMHEMNGTWYPWCGTVNGNRPEEFVTVWRHLYRMFGDAGATAARWVWSPYATSYPATAENAIARYYPGDDVVDVIGLDAYNWGTARLWSRWESFAELVRPAYEVVAALTDKPVVIAETASAEAGGDKAAWIRDVYRTLAAHYPRVEAVVWFNADKECDWRIESSPASLAAFCAAARAARAG